MLLPSYLDANLLQGIVQNALAEDVGTGDVTSEATIPASRTATAHFLAKEDGVLAGCRVAEIVFREVDESLSTTWIKADGETLLKGEVFGKVTGPARSLLTAERVALNIMQRMSGIATATRRMVDAAAGTHARILDTRKTVPGLRVLDKWAVLLGGGTNHRIGLYDRVLIKDNHISAAGNIASALSRTHQHLEDDPRRAEIEIETRTLEEVKEVVRLGGVKYILLDNMVRIGPDGTIDVSMLKQAVELVDGRFLTEASGNVTLKTVGKIASTGVDYISSGSLTHSVKALDISLKIDL